MPPAAVGVPRCGRRSPKAGLLGYITAAVESSGSVKPFGRVLVHEGREEKEAFKSFFGWNGPERMLSKLPAKMEEDRLLQQSLRLSFKI